MVLQVDIPGPVGRLEGLYEEPASVPIRFAAVVCHPHPLFGGTLHNHATYRLARAVRAEGGASLRFNFRGVGRSAGRHDQGRGEKDDLRAALSWLADRCPGLPLHACGFSFGAWMALAVGCGEGAPPVRGLLVAGLAVQSFDLELVRRCKRPISVVQAELDQLGSPDEVRALLAGSEAPRRLAIVPKATHLFTEDLTSLQREAEFGLSWLLENG
jgi:alpha/beta superfamily hydrolase